MDDKRLRAVIREEITLAVKTLHEAAGWTEADEDALIAVRRTVESFEHIYLRTCEAADAERVTAAENPFEETNEDARRRITHAAGYLPEADLNALPAGAYKLLGGMARNDAYTNAVIRLVQHGGPLIDSEQTTAPCEHVYDLEDDGNGHSGWFCVRCGSPRPE